LHVVEQERAQGRGGRVVDDLYAAAAKRRSVLLDGDRDHRLAQGAASSTSGLRAAHERLVDLDDRAQPVAAGRGAPTHWSPKARGPYPEGRAALASARRAGGLTPTVYRKALEDFETSHSELLVVAIDDRLARHAGQVAEDLGLRGYDAVHLASSLALGADTTVITRDLELSRAADHSGLAVAPAP